MATSCFMLERFMHNYVEENRHLLPISGYESYPLVSLKEACKPLKRILDKSLKTYVKIALKACEKPKDDLTVDESASLYLYTMEWGIRENSLYYILNATLRNAERGSLVPWYLYLKLMLTAFYKIPRSKEKNLWRGIAQDMSRTFKDGNEFPWWSLTSCSSKINTMKSSSFLGNAQHRTLLSIETKSGRSLKNHSAFPTEEEVLLPPGRQLRVIGHYSPSPDLSIIQLKEIKPPYKMLMEPFPMPEEEFDPFSKKRSESSVSLEFIAFRLQEKVQKKDKKHRDPSQTTPLPRKFASGLSVKPKSPSSSRSVESNQAKKLLNSAFPPQFHSMTPGFQASFGESELDFQNTVTF